MKKGSGGVGTENGLPIIPPRPILHPFVRHRPFRPSRLPVPFLSLLLVSSPLGGC